MRQNWVALNCYRKEHHHDRLSLWPTRISSLTLLSGFQAFNLGRSAWSMLNLFRTGQGRRAAHLYKWHMASSDRCQCGGVQTTSHIVELCPLTRFDGDCFGFTQLMTVQSRGFTKLLTVQSRAFTQLMTVLHSTDDCAVAWLHSADDCAVTVTWLQNVAVKPFAK